MSDKIIGESNKKKPGKKKKKEGKLAQECSKRKSARDQYLN